MTLHRLALERLTRQPTPERVSTFRRKLSLLGAEPTAPEQPGLWARPHEPRWRLIVLIDGTGDGQVDYVPAACTGTISLTDAQDFDNGPHNSLLPTITLVSAVMPVICNVALSAGHDVPRM